MLYSVKLEGISKSLNFNESFWLTIKAILMHFLTSRTFSGICTNFNPFKADLPAYTVCNIFSTLIATNLCLWLFLSYVQVAYNINQIWYNTESAVQAYYSPSPSKIITNMSTWIFVLSVWLIRLGCVIINFNLFTWRITFSSSCIDLFITTTCCPLLGNSADDISSSIMNVSLPG